MSGSAPKLIAQNPPELPMPGFDPLKEPEERELLARYWLPPYPDEATQPELLAHWRALFAGPPSYVPSVSEPDQQRWKSENGGGSAESQNGPFAPARPSRPHFGAGPELSHNWSGGYVTASRDDRMVQVVGRWIAPSIALGDGTNEQGLPHRCSIWIGIDGRARWAASLPQLGSEHTVFLGRQAQTHRLWWQWWTPGRSYPFYINGIAIEPGDPILCHLRMDGRQRAIFHVKNDHPDRRKLATIAAICEHPIEGNSAEWIVERPNRPEEVNGLVRTGPLHPSPDFGCIDVQGFAAWGEPDFRRGGHTYTMATARLITSTEIKQNPTRIAAIGEPERRRRADELGVTYRDKVRPTAPSP